MLTEPTLPPVVDMKVPSADQDNLLNKDSGDRLTFVVGVNFRFFCNIPVVLDSPNS